MPRTLLIADDSITMQKVVSITFASEDFSVITAGTGEEALAKAREVRPDIILADVAMPRGNGYELCQVVKGDAALRHIPVLLLVGTSEGFDQGRATAAQADGHINKPFDTQVMIDKVGSMLGIAPQAAPGAPAPQAPTPSTVPLAPPAAASPGWPSTQRPTIPAPAGGAASRPFVAPAPNRFSSPTTPGAPVPAGFGAPRPIPPTPGPSTLPPNALRPSNVPTGSVVRPSSGLGSPLPPAPTGFTGFGAPTPSASVPPVPNVPRVPTPMSPLPSLGTLPSPPPPAPVAPRPPFDAAAKPASSPPWALPSSLANPAGPGAPPRASPPWPTPGASGIPARPYIPQAGTGLPSDFGRSPQAPPPAPTPPAAPVVPPRSVTTAWAPTTVTPSPAPMAPPAAMKPGPSDDLTIDDDIGPIQETSAWTGESKEASNQGFELDLQVGMDTPLSATEPPHPIGAPAPVAHLAAPPMQAPASTPVAPTLSPAAEAAPVRAVPADGGEAALKLALSQASREVIERIVWEVVPQLAEVIVKEHVERLARERAK